MLSATRNWTRQAIASEPPGGGLGAKTQVPAVAGEGPQGPGWRCGAKAWPRLGGVSSSPSLSGSHLSSVRRQISAGARTKPVRVKCPEGGCPRGEAPPRLPPQTPLPVRSRPSSRVCPGGGAQKEWSLRTPAPPSRSPSRGSGGRVRADHPRAAAHTWKALGCQQPNDCTLGTRG